MLKVVVTETQIKILASLVGPEWTSIAAQIKFPDERIAKIGQDFPTAEAACVRVLEMWKEQQGVLATGADLQTILQEAGQFNEDVAAVLTGDSDRAESPLKKRKLSGGDEPTA